MLQTVETGSPWERKSTKSFTPPVCRNSSTRLWGRAGAPSVSMFSDVLVPALLPSSSFWDLSDGLSSSVCAVSDMSSAARVSSSSCDNSASPSVPMFSKPSDETIESLSSSNAEANVGASATAEASAFAPLPATDSSGCGVSTSNISSTAASLVSGMFSSMTTILRPVPGSWSDVRGQSTARS